MAGLPDLLKRMSHYSLANLAIMAAGIVSFPILTRVLSVSEYGILGLNVTLLTLLVSLAKAGLQHSSVRLWPEWEGRRRGVEQFTLTFFVSALLFSVPVLVFYAGTVALLRPFIGAELARFILLASPLLVIQSLGSFGQNLLRARQWSRQRASFDVAQSYAAMILAVLGATVVVGGLRGYYLGLIAGQALSCLLLVLTVLRWTRLRASNFSPSLLREAVSYGFPMSVAELAGALLHLGDRFVLQALRGESAVGYYTMAFNLAMYINTLFTMPMDMAAVPMVAALYEQKGSAAASELLSKAVRFFFMFAAPAVAGAWVIKEDVVSLLASRQFLPGAGLVHLLLAGFLLYGSRSLLGAGMLLRKRVWLVAQLELGSAILNLLLAVLLIPRLGVPGAAVATLLSQLAGAAMVFVVARPLLPVRVDLLALLRFVACAAGMAFVVAMVRVEPAPVRLILHIVLGAVLYGALLLMVDGDTRRWLGRALRRRASAG